MLKLEKLKLKISQLAVKQTLQKIVLFMLPLLCLVFIGGFMSVKRDPEEAYMTAYKKWLTQGEIQWFPGDELLVDNLFFAICDLEGDGIPELIVQNTFCMTANQPREKIYKYSSDGLVELFWESRDSYEYVLVYDEIGQFFQTTHGVQGGDTETYYSAVDGKKLGSKMVGSTTQNPDGIFPVKVVYTWDDKEVDALEYEEKVYNLLICPTPKEVEFRKNTEIERETYFK